ncbi:MAG: DUF5715 family protein [Acidobacteria bacterium]|nr:DUF5715 family protein [Acidobacteriota bacterium]
MRRAFLFIIIAALIGSTAWAVRRFISVKRLRESTINIPTPANNRTPDHWTAAVEKVKADRGEPMGGGAAATTPAELRHYSERYWFLATQIADVAKHNLQICRDYFDLAAMIQRGEIVSVPGVSETYVLYGVGQRVNDEAFTPAEDSVADHTALQALAKNLGGRSYNLDDPAAREALKGSMLSSLRPAAFKVLQEVASAYHRQFARPLPVSSLVRPEQYQQSLRRVNRNAVLIETPPHSTGLAFDIDYRYMSGAEQTFVMAELARLKNEGRIEAIRERNANYHVFAFLDGTRPSDDLIASKLDEAVPPGRQAHHASEKKETKKAAKRSSGSKRKPAPQRRQRRRRR